MDDKNDSYAADRDLKQSLTSFASCLIINTTGMSCSTLQCPLDLI